MPKIVSQTGHVYDVGAEREFSGHFTTNLGDFERVGKPGASKVSVAW
jgi:hypothetical protein